MKLKLNSKQNLNYIKKETWKHKTELNLNIKPKNKYI